jgi:pyridoxal phosphate enzyme (YggS family)
VSTSTSSGDIPLATRLHSVQSEVADAARAAGRPLQDITTIVVTKFHPASLVRELADLGVTNFGENRLQDAAPKAALLTDLDLTWHFIGQLQSNKVRSVLEFASVVHSVDRESLVTAMKAVGEPVDVFIQLNLTDDPHRGGVQPADLDRLAQLVLEDEQLRLMGLMAVAPLSEEPRHAFERVRLASESLRAIAPNAAALSMGMSSDFSEAILEGATHLRIGTAITGNRPDGG